MNTVNNSYRSLQDLYKFAHENATKDISLRDVPEQGNATSGPLLGGRTVIAVDNSEDVKDIRQQLVDHMRGDGLHIDQEYFTNISNKLLGGEVRNRQLKGEEMSEAMVYALSSPTNVSALLQKTMHGLGFPPSSLHLIRATISECARHPDVIAFLTTQGDDDLAALQKVCALAVQRHGDAHPQAAAFLRGFSGSATATPYVADLHATNFTADPRGETGTEGLIFDFCSDADIAKTIGDKNTNRKDLLNGIVYNKTINAVTETMKGANLTETQCKNILGFFKHQLSELLKANPDKTDGTWEQAITECLDGAVTKLKSDFEKHAKANELTDFGKSFTGTVKNGSNAGNVHKSKDISQLEALESQPFHFEEAKPRPRFQKAMQAIASVGQTVKRGAQFVGGGVKSLVQRTGAKIAQILSVFTNKIQHHPEEPDVYKLLLTEEDLVQPSSEGDGIEMINIVNDVSANDETVKEQAAFKALQKQEPEQSALHERVNKAFGDEFRTHTVTKLYDALTEELTDDEVKQRMKFHPNKGELIKQLDASLKKSNVSYAELSKAYPNIVRLIKAENEGLNGLDKPLSTCLMPLIQHFTSRKGNDESSSGQQSPAQLENVSYPSNFANEAAKQANEQISAIWSKHQNVVETASKIRTEEKKAIDTISDETTKKSRNEDSANIKYAAILESEQDSTAKTLELIKTFKTEHASDGLGIDGGADQQRTDDFREFMQREINSTIKSYTRDMKDKLVNTFKQLPPALLNLWSNKAIESNQKLVYNIVLKLADVQDAKLPNDSAESMENALDPLDFKTREQVPPENEYPESGDNNQGDKTYSIGNEKISLKVSATKNNPGGGDCFFYSILDGLNKVKNTDISPVLQNTNLLRQKLVTHFETLLMLSKSDTEEKQPKGFKFQDGQCLVASGDGYTDVTPAFNEYLGTDSGLNPLANYPDGHKSYFGEKIEQSHVWADSAQGAFLADMLKRPVVILNTKFPQAPSIICFDRSLTSAKPLAGDPIVLSFTGGHYEQTTLDDDSMVKLKQHLAQSKLPQTA